MKRGEAFEARLQWQHARYSASGAALIVKTPPDIKLIRALGAGRFVATFRGKGPPDYLGVLASGRAVACEAKSYRGKRWKLGNLAPHQASVLHDWSELGGLAVLVISQGRETTWAMEWSALAETYDRWRMGEALRGGASLSVADLDRLGARCVGVDWIAALGVS